jgi:hypothetical protein
MLKFAEPTFDPESVAATEKLNVPAAVVVPVKAPPEAKLNPAGRLPEET